MGNLLLRVPLFLHGNVYKYVQLSVSLTWQSVWNRSNNAVYNLLPSPVLLGFESVRPCAIDWGCADSGSVLLKRLLVSCTRACKRRAGFLLNFRPSWRSLTVSDVQGRRKPESHNRAVIMGSGLCRCLILLVLLSCRARR